MKKYRDKSNEVYEFDNDVNKKFLNEKIEELGLISVTDEEIAEIRKQKDLDNQVLEKQELASLLCYMMNTDYIATKCYEKNLDVEKEYPDEYAKREKVRHRINKLREIIKK